MYTPKDYINVAVTMHYTRVSRNEPKNKRLLVALSRTEAGGVLNISMIQANCSTCCHEREREEG